MAAVLRPDINLTETSTIPGSSACGGPLVVYEKYLYRRRYYDNTYRARLLNYLPLLKMPYRRIDSLEVNKVAPRPSGSAVVHFRNCYGSHNPGISTSQSIARAQSRATSDLYERIGDLDTFDLGLALAEGKKTISLVTDTATRIYRAFRSLKRGNLKKTFELIGLRDNVKLESNRFGPNGSHLKFSGDHRRYLQRQYRRRDAARFAARSWLELTYGWKPLLSDIDGAAEKLATMLNANTSDVIVRGTGEDVINYESATSTVVHRGTFSAKCYWSVELKVVDDKLRLKTSLGLTNPASLAWELLPFSFIADWFIPIGAWVDGLSVLNGYSIVQKSRTTVTRLSGLSETTPTNTFVKSGFTASLSLLETETNRVTTVNPTLRSPFFDMGTKLGASRLTTALSLLKVTFGK